MYKRATLFIIGIAILAFVLYMVDFYEVMRLMLAFPVKYFLLLVMVEILVIIFSSLKWKVVLKGTKVSTWDLVPISMVGYLVNNLTPIGLAGGEPVRAYILYKTKKVPIERAFASVIVDLFLEILPIFILAIISIALILIQGIPIEIAFVLGLLTIILLGLFAVSIGLVTHDSFSQKIIEIFIKCVSFLPGLKKRVAGAKSKIDDVREKFTKAIKESMADTNVLICGTLISGIKWLLVLARVYLVFLGLGIKISFSQVLIAETAVLVLSGLPLLPGALGIWEGASVVLFSTIAGILPSKAAAATLIDRILFYLLPSVIGAVLAVHYGINILKGEDLEKENALKAEILKRRR